MVLETGGHLLGMLNNQKSGFVQCMVIHLQHFDPLFFSKMEQDILADNKAHIIPDRLETQEVMLLEFNPFSYLFGDNTVLRVSWIHREIPLKDPGGNAFQFFGRVTPFLYYGSELVTLIDVGGKELYVPEHHRTHIFPQDDCNGVGFLSHCTPPTPHIDITPQAYGGKYMVTDEIECLEIPEEIRKCHDNSPAGDTSPSEFRVCSCSHRCSHGEFTFLTYQWEANSIRYCIRYTQRGDIHQGYQLAQSYPDLNIRGHSLFFWTCSIRYILAHSGISIHVPGRCPMISVLLIDDDPELLEIISLELGADSDFVIQSCNSAKGALELTNTVKFDSIICDHYMPEMDGCSLMQLLRSRGCDAQLVLYSGKGPDNDIKNALESYMDEYVQRRGNPEEELSELAAIIRASASRKKQIV